MVRLSTNKKRRRVTPKVIKSNTELVLPQATIKEAVQQRILPPDHSSIIPGIDVNELKHSLDLLKYALDYSEAIVDSVRLPLIVLNKKLQVLTANRSFYDTFKLTPEETENKLIYKLNGGAWNIPKFTLLLEEILPANTQLDDYEVEIDFPHIGQKTMLVNAKRTYRQVNNTEAILLAFEDITARKQLELQKDNFIGIVSHELKTPLTNIKNFAYLLEKHNKTIKDTRSAYFLSKMTQQMEILTQVMASFVNVYQIQNGKLSLHKTNFDIEKLVGSVVADFQYTAVSHSIEHEEKPSKSVYADRERIAQVLVNLISNAIKYSPTKDRITISSTSDEKFVTISVQDYGFGIPLGEQANIFDRFFRVKGKKEYKISGLGLGLFISQEIIAQHGGKIWVKSIEGKGSTFYFTLPLKHKIG